ncbi:hypothetical protein PRIC1_006607 [Phytophthora ramorum]
MTTSAISSSKHGAFTRAHSLEIPDADGDTFMDDLEFQDAPDFLRIFEDVWHEDMPIEVNCVRPNKRPRRDPDLDFNCFASPASVDIADVGTRSAFEQPPRKPNRAKRISNKQKIHALRDEVKELASQLQALGTASLRAEVGGGAFVMSRDSQLWEPIAARQLEQRQAAEEENAKLRDMMNLQVQEARRLRRVLERRANRAAATSFDLL